MEFETCGGGKTNIIFLHGWGAGKRSFVWTKQYLTNFALHFASIDGFDGTAAPNDPTIAGYAERLHAYITSKKLNNVVLVGHSFGGRIAIEYAAEHPVFALILVDSAGLKPKFSFKKFANVVRYKCTKRLVKLGLIKKSVLAKFGSSDYKACSEEMKNVFLSAIRYNQTKQLSKICAPTLLVWGDKDKDTPTYMAKIMHKRIKNSELVMLNGGHFSFLDEPYKFCKVIDYFINNIEGEKHE